MIRRQLWRGVSVTWLLGAGVVWALVGNVNSCSDLPPQIYYRNTPAQYVNVAFKNDTPVHSATWDLFVGPNLTYDMSCANGLVKYAAEVASNGCSTSTTLAGGHLTVQISGCTTPLPARSGHSTLFSVCYSPADYGTHDFDGTCTAQNNSTGPMNCSFSYKTTTVADVFMSTTIPATVASNGGEVRVASWRMGTDELVYSTHFSTTSTGNILFADTSNVLCCAMLRGGGAGCPDSGSNIVAAVADTPFPAGCAVYTSAVAPGSKNVSAQINCESGMTQASRTIVSIAKFCYMGQSSGAEVLTNTGTATPYSAPPPLVVDFPSQSVTVTP